MSYELQAQIVSRLVKQILLFYVGTLTLIHLAYRTRNCQGMVALSGLVTAMTGSESSGVL